MSELGRLVDGFAAAASAAGAAVMAHYRCCAGRAKSDGSPVTDADLAAEAAILPALRSLMPGTPILSEESADAFPQACSLDEFLVVDPLDGTREFLAGNGEFTVNIALCRAGLPVAGVVYAPASERLWGAAETAFACSVSPGGPTGSAHRRPIHVRSADCRHLVAVASRSHMDPRTEAYLAELAVVDRVGVGSSVKFCLLAEGQADIYPRFSPTMEWDTAAGHAVLRAAGGTVLQPDGSALIYGKRRDGFRNGAFVAASDAALIRAA